MNTHLSSSNRPRETSIFKLMAVLMLLALCTVIMVPSAWSQEGTAPSSGTSTEGGTPSSAGMGAASAVATILYFPFKAAFAIGGGIVGGLAYAFSGGNEKAAKSIWDTSLRGTYYISPDHLEGNRPIRFLGVADPNDGSEPASAPEPVR
ncbi:MAG TPA: hypothetical protein VJU54_11870 [Nitrospiraceae bacterium]|nr:hypothetical protein [Nitrospiraceae bacterium]